MQASCKLSVFGVQYMVILTWILSGYRISQVRKYMGKFTFIAVLLRYRVSQVNK